MAKNVNGHLKVTDIGDRGMIGTSANFVFFSYRMVNLHSRYMVGSVMVVWMIENE